MISLSLTQCHINMIQACHLYKKTVPRPSNLLDSLKVFDKIQCLKSYVRLLQNDKPITHSLSHQYEKLHICITCMNCAKAYKSSLTF